LPCSPDFIAPSLTAAYQVAYLFATIIQSAVRLVNKFSNASGAFGSNTGVTSTLIGPGACNVALTFVPSGVYLVNAAMG
jgi:hypothetical protein